MVLGVEGLESSKKEYRVPFLKASIGLLIKLESEILKGSWDAVTSVIHKR